MFLAIREEVDAVGPEGVGGFGLDDLLHERSARLLTAEEVADAGQVAIFDVQLDEASNVGLGPR